MIEPSLRFPAPGAGRRAGDGTVVSLITGVAAKKPTEPPEAPIVIVPPAIQIPKASPVRVRTAGRVVVSSDSSILAVGSVE
jgi:hypothetical protein